MGSNENNKINYDEWSYFFVNTPVLPCFTVIFTISVAVTWMLDEILLTSCYIDLFPLNSSTHQAFSLE